MNILKIILFIQIHNLFVSFVEGELLIGNQQVINYEAISTFVYTLIISVNDGQASSDPVTLTLQLIDINEAPHFSSRLYFIDVMEGKVKKEHIFNSIYHDVF